MVNLMNVICFDIITTWECIIMFSVRSKCDDGDDADAITIIAPNTGGNAGTNGEEGVSCFQLNSV